MGMFSGPINKGDNLSGDYMSSQAVQNIVKEYADYLGYSLSAHDLRRTFAQLARKAKRPIDQIQLTLGHASVQTN
jgi:integrase